MLFAEMYHFPSSIRHTVAIEKIWSTTGSSATKSPSAPTNSHSLFLSMPLCLYNCHDEISKLQVSDCTLTPNSSAYIPIACLRSRFSVAYERRTTQHLPCMRHNQRYGEPTCPSVPCGMAYLKRTVVFRRRRKDH